MRTIEFRVEYCDQMGTIGLAPIGAGEVFSPLSEPFGLAHDCVDHIQGFINAGSEIVAHANLARTRLETGFTTDPNPSSPADFGGLEARNIWPAWQTSPGQYLGPQEPIDYAEETLRDILRGMWDEIEEEDRTWEFVEFLRQYKRHFRRGYRLSEQAYSSTLRAFNLYADLEEFFEDATQDLEEKQGAELTIRIDGYNFSHLWQFECQSCGRMIEEEFSCDSCFPPENEENT